MEEDTTGDVEQKIVRQFPVSSRRTILALVVAVALVASAGVATGWFLSGTGNREVKSESVVASDAQGEFVDTEAFPDVAEGILRSGGIDDEGTHHLERGEGPAQYAYLTSTVMDLGVFEGKKVKVWGKTAAAKKAGWLMEVGKVSIIE